jgi:predicted transcriptional regulator
VNDHPILLTIKEIYANRILDGEQTVEHRVRPPRISKPTRTIMYVPVAQEIIGEFIMGHVDGELDALGYPREVSDPLRYAKPLSWATVRGRIPEIRSPQQSFRYLDPENSEDARLLSLLSLFRSYAERRAHV